MIIPLWVKIPVSLAKKHIRNVSRNNATCKEFGWLETAALHKTEWTKFSENKENQTIHLPPSEHSWQVANNVTALFSRALISVSVVASIPCTMNRTWGRSHTCGNFPRSKLVTDKMATEEILKLPRFKIAHQCFWIFNCLRLSVDSEDGFCTDYQNVGCKQQLKAVT